MNCDPIARWYRWLEYAAFGRRLELCRNHYLGSVSGARRVLMLGEGDGRFLSAFTAVSAGSEVDYVDMSGEMIAIACRRLTRAPIGGAAAMRFFRFDVRHQALPRNSYDLIVTHFFLDCFNDQEIREIADKAVRSAAPDAQWLVSEFRQPSFGIWKYVAMCILRVLYQFFRWTTGLEAQSLPSYRSVLSSKGFVLEGEKIFLKGLLASELWRRTIPTQRS